MEKKIKLYAVVLTYNRLSYLKRALNSFDIQTEKCDTLIVVNNNSNDGTSCFLSKWKSISSEYNKVILNLTANTGGSGGFYEGMKYALSKNPDWLWISDDDAYLYPDAIESLYNYLNTHDTAHTAAICSSVYSNGKVDCMHRSFFKKNEDVKIRPSSPSDYDKESFNIDFLSYVGAVLNAHSLRKVGIVKKELFIFFDDTEHSMRLKKDGNIICVPNIKVEHDRNIKISKKDDNILLTWKDYYAIRNLIYIFKSYYLIMSFSYSYQKIKNSLIAYMHGNYNLECIKLIFSAVFDGWCGRLGLNAKYKPNFKIKNNKNFLIK